MVIWNPWKEAPEISKSRDFDLPIRQAPNGGYELQASAGPICTCVSSDFFLQEADGWRRDAWNIIRERTDLRLSLIHISNSPPHISSGEVPNSSQKTPKSQNSFREIRKDTIQQINKISFNNFV